MIPLPERIAQRVAALPAHPGVYLMRNAAGEVIGHMGARPETNLRGLIADTFGER